MKNRVLVSSIVRNAGADDGSGFLRIVDLDSGTVLHKEQTPEPVWRSRDPNPRGGMRGARGLCLFQDGAVLANADAIYHFGPDWTLRWRITNPILGSVHSISADERGIYAACVHADAIVKIAPNATKPCWLWDWRTDPTVCAALGLPKTQLPFNRKRVDFRDPAVNWATVWLNGVRVMQEGGQTRLLVCMGRVPSAEVIMAAQAGEVIAWKDAGPFRAMLFSIVLGSPRETRLVDECEIPGFAPAHMGVCQLLLPIPEDEPDSFIRGAACTDDAEGYWWGNQKPLRLMGVLREILLDGHEDECVFDICALPDSFWGVPVASIFGRMNAIQTLRAESREEAVA